MSTSGSVHAELAAALAALNGVILGKEREIRLCLACLIARGHLLIEDVPGVGKTTLAQALARALGLGYRRIQFTSDLLPADVIGVSVYDRETARFSFHPGPVFSELVLADEINRATPKAQSALLEAMEERQITADGTTHALPDPFFVVATQNPSYQLGTYALPESELDRFLMRLSLGYPTPDLERELLRGVDRRTLIGSLTPVFTAARLRDIQSLARRLHVSDPLLDYVQALVAATRSGAHCPTGLSPRAAIALVHAAQAWALLNGRSGVIPEDVQAVFVAVAAHRLQTDGSGSGALDVERSILRSVPIP